MKKNILSVVIVIALLSVAAKAQNSQFLPSHLAVLRAGDGVVNLRLKQAPVFVDQFDPNGFNPAPSFTVRIPTNGPDTLFFNSHAATEGVLTRWPTGGCSSLPVMVASICLKNPERPRCWRFNAASAPLMSPETHTRFCINRMMWSKR